MKISPANQRPELELADIENIDEYVEYSESCIPTSAPSLVQEKSSSK